MIDEQQAGGVFVHLAQTSSVHGMAAPPLLPRVRLFISRLTFEEKSSDLGKKEAGVPLKINK